MSPFQDVEGGVCAAAGVRAASVAAGIKESGRADMVLLLFEPCASGAGVFTRNRVSAAPVALCRRRLERRGRLRAVLVNSGNANACTGSEGLDRAERLCRALAERLGFSEEEVIMASTGIIGVQLPEEKMKAALGDLVAGLSSEGGAAAAEAIMTTDTRPKEHAIELELPGGKVRVGGMAKGSGMIAPNMATMLAFITTDAVVDSGVLRPVLQAACAETIRRFSGHVVRTNDGGLLAYFGFPSALEHAARLAVQAGLALTGETFAGLEMRIGIHTGLIITGGDPNLPDTIGRTSALAVRLRTLAASNDLVVSAATQRIVAGYFKWAAAEGGADRPDAFRVLGESGAVTRLGAAAALTPLTGRDAEITALSERWHEARRGRFQARLLTGDPGIGKSRLVLALKQEVARAPGAIRELQCLPEFSQSPFQPLIRMLEDLSGISAEDEPETRFSRLAGYLESQHGATDLHEVIPLFATMMSLPIAAPYRPPTTPLRTQRERIMSAIADQLRGVAAKTPVLLVVEDLHWCDPTTLELLSRIVQDTEPHRVLVLCTARPEFVPPWPESAMLQSRLPPLSDDDVGALINALELDVPADAARNIVANADGVPLFAEELARALPPTGYDRSVGVPMTLQDLLAARLDVLEDTKSTAQLAAAVGREFSLAVLRDVSPLDEKELVAAIARLRDAGLLSPTGEDGFKFRHALFQDAAYRSQARDDRMAAHRGIAETLQARFPNVARDHPEILARHWGEAGEAETAIGFWVRAGRRANLHCANKEAIARFNAGLKLAEALPEGQRRIQLQFDLQVGLGAAHFAAEGYASSDGADAYAQAVELGERHTGNPDLFNAHWGLWACTSSRADYDESLGMTLGLLRMGARSGDPVKEQQGHFAVGNIRFWRGEFAEARDHLEHAMTLYRPEHHERLVTDFGENAYVTSGAYLSWTLGILGFAEQAEKTARRALDEARRIDHPFSLGYTLTFVTVLQRMLRRPAETLTYAEETIALAEEHDFPLWKAGATLKQGWAMVRQGDGKGIERMRESVESVASLMSGITLIFLETLADSLLDIGAHEDALATIAEGWDFVTELGDHHVEAELHRLKGECLLRCSAFDPSGAEICFHRALTVARRQQAKLLELRAARSMARLWQEQDRSDDARALLADVYDRFTEGFDTPDLRDTRALLDSLGAK